MGQSRHRTSSGKAANRLLKILYCGVFILTGEAAGATFIAGEGLARGERLAVGEGLATGGLAAGDALTTGAADMVGDG